MRANEDSNMLERGFKLRHCGFCGIKVTKIGGADDYGDGGGGDDCQSSIIYFG